MGGCFDYAIAPDGTDGAEYNFAGDPKAAKKVVEEWPTPVVVSPWEVGLKLEYPPEAVLADFPAGTSDPVVRAAYTYWPEPKGEVMNRLWDPTTILPLTEGETLVPLSEMGGISVDTNGVTTFTADASSNRCYQIASNMNATAVMNRYREICRMGNPSLPEAVRCIKDAGVDYNGHDLMFKVPKFSLGAYGSNDVHMVFAFDDKSYEPDEVTYDPVLEVFSVHFAVPEEDATAGSSYNGKLTIALENDMIGTNVIKEVPTQIVQGRQEQAGSGTDWFNEASLEAPTNYVPAAAMPERCFATVGTTVAFTGQTFTVEYQTATNVVQGAVRIVEDGADGYKFQYYACVGKTNEDSFVRGWWDFNVAGEDVSEIKPKVGTSYTVRAEAYYFEDARGEENTLVISVAEEGSNRGLVKQFIGSIVNKDGGQGGTTRLHSVGFVGDGEVSSLIGNYYTNTVNATLAKIDGDREYATVAAAVAAAEGSPIRLLHAANWKPTAADLGKPVRFLNKSDLVLDLSDLPDAQGVWTKVDGNNGTLTLIENPVPVTPGEAQGPFDTAEEATNAAKKAVLTLRDDVAAALGSDKARQTYRDMFEFNVVPAADGKWAVGAFLKEPDWTNVVESAQEATRQIPVAELAAHEYGIPLKDVPLTNCVPGFFYSLYDGSAVTNMKANIRSDDCNILCGPDTTVVLPAVLHPVPTSGFFSIGVLEAPSVIPGVSNTATNRPASGGKSKEDVLK